MAAIVVICTPYAAPRQKGSGYVDHETAIRTMLPNFGYQLAFKQHSIAKVMDRNIDYFLAPIHSRRSQDSATKALQGDLSDEQLEAMSAWSREGVMEAGLLKADEDLKKGKRKLIDPSDDIELRTYIEIFEGSGFTAPTNWYRTWRVNYEDDVEGGLPKDFPSHIPVLFMPAEKDFALPPVLSEGMERYFKGEFERWPINTTHWAMTDSVARDKITSKMLDFYRKHIGKVVKDSKL